MGVVIVSVAVMAAMKPASDVGIVAVERAENAV